MGRDNIIEPMKKGSANSWLGEYFWVSLPVTDSNSHLNIVTTATEWCCEHFGKSSARWFEKKQRFFFKDEKDMTLFILRFCS